MTSNALVELSVHDLGIIGDLRLVFESGMTAVTGETGAGKTLIVGAIDLLVGGRADPTLVRPGTDEARVEGRFVIDDEEVILARVVPRDGRSRAYVNGSLATASALAEWGARLVDLHGQHAHQSLLATSTQRAALDRFAGVDLGAYETARAELASIELRLAELGGDERERAREIDLLTYQLDEIDAAKIVDADEDERLDREEDELNDAVGHQKASALGVAAISDDGGALDALSSTLGAVEGRAPFDDISSRLQGVVAELSDVASELRALGETIADDPERLDEIRQRRQLLRDLRRKYGDDVSSILSYRDEIAERLEELTSRESRAAALDAERVRVAADVADLAAVIAADRLAAAPSLAAAIAERLGSLAMAGAEIAIAVEGPDPRDDVAMSLSANKGSPPLPLRKVASGGELARTMLAIRLVLTVGPPVLVFDEVDAGIGGEAASAVGGALAEIAREHQVLVVTHLPQVAVWADQHVRVEKSEAAGSTVSSAAVLDRDQRIAELARMLSGHPDSVVATDHAAALLLEATDAKAQS